MILYGIRLLVALLTFAVGVAAALVFNCKSAPASAGGDVRTVSVLLGDDAPQPRRSCSLESRRVVDGGLLQTKTIDESSPAYPPSAKTARLGGKVAVKVEVDEGGRVSKAHAGTGFGMLPEAAVKDALEARFEPRRGPSGRPARVSGVILYNFVLD